MAKRRNANGYVAKKLKSTATLSQVRRPEGPQKLRRNMRGGRGCLQDLPKMPLEILYEVFASLQPLDLLHLARTSKDCRALLMSRLSLPLWKSARRNVPDMPDCPPYLSEPAYADLMFTHRCHGCLKDSIHTQIEWEFSVRYCRRCKRDRIVTPSVDMNVPISRVLHDSSGSQFYHKPDEDKAQKIFQSLENAQERGDYLTAQKALGKVVDEHSSLCDRWLSVWEIARREEVANIKQSPLNGILAKLRELGWEEELDLLEQPGSDYTFLTNAPRVYLARPLRARSWRIIKNDIIELMKTHKANRLLKARVDLVATRLTLLWDARRQLCQDVRADAIPTPYEFALLPEVRAIVDAPHDVIVDKASFEVLRPSISDITERWFSEKKTLIENLFTNRILSSHRRSRSGTTPFNFNFDLAMSLGLQCDSCRKACTFPNVVFHCCCYGKDSHPLDVNEYQIALDSMTYHGPFNTSDLKVDMKVVKSIILACGQDPSRVTLAEMDELTTRLTCEGCHEKGDLEVMTWRAALRHFHSHLWNTKPAQWLVVSDEDARHAKDLEERAVGNAKAKNAGPESWVACWQCRHCRIYYLSEACVREHVEYGHGSHGSFGRDRKPTQADARYDTDLELPPNSVHLASETRRVGMGEPGYTLRLRFEDGEAKYYEYTTKVPNDEV